MISNIILMTESFHSKNNTIITSTILVKSSNLELLQFGNFVNYYVTNRTSPSPIHVTRDHARHKFIMQLVSNVARTVRSMAESPKGKLKQCV